MKFVLIPRADEKWRQRDQLELAGSGCKGKSDGDDQGIDEDCGDKKGMEDGRVSCQLNRIKPIIKKGVRKPYLNDQQAV